MPNTLFDGIVTPKSDELLVVVLGNGYGECIVCHLGDNEWMIVDSFIHEQTKNPIAIDLLDAINVDLSAVRCILITHWHKDHIEGMARLVGEAGSAAVFVTSAATYDLVGDFLDQLDSRPRRYNMPTHEYREVVRVLTNAGRGMFEAAADRLLMKVGSCSVTAVSPNVAVKTAIANELLKLGKGSVSLISSKLLDRNAHSTACLLASDQAHIFLGADLENDSTGIFGWQHATTVLGKLESSVTLNKVAHHGSDTGHSDEFYTTMCKAGELLSTVTAFTQGSNQLPEPAMLTTIAAHSSKVHVVGRSSESGASSHASGTRILISMARNVAVRRHCSGAVVHRMPKGEKLWTTEIKGSAYISK